MFYQIRLQYLTNSSLPTSFNINQPILEYVQKLKVKGMLTIKHLLQAFELKFIFT